MPKVVVIGAGIVGTSLADELTARGWTDVTVLDRGPLFTTGGSTSHAPGLVFQTNPSKTMSAVRALHRREVRRTRASRRLVVQRGRRPRGRHHPGARGPTCTARPAGPRLGDRRATCSTPTECARCTRCWTATASSADSTPRPTDWRRRCAPPRRRRRGPSRAARRSWPHTEVLGIVERGGRVTGVETARRRHRRRHRRLRAPASGVPQLGQAGRPRRPAGPDGPPVRQDRPDRRAGRTQHRAVRGRAADPAPPGPGPVLPRARRPHRHRLLRPPADAGRHVARLHDRHRAVSRCRRCCRSPRRTSHPRWRESRELLPALGDSKVEEAFNGIFSFTPDGFSIMGEHRDLAGFWVAEAVWVTHSAGVAKADGRVDRRRRARRPTCTSATCTGSRTSPAARTFIMPTSSQAFVEVYDIIHPHQYRDRAARTARPARSTRGSRNSAPTSTRAAAGSARPGTRPTPNWRNDFAPTAGVPGARRLVVAVLVTDLDRGGALDPGARRDVRHDAADPLRGRRAPVPPPSCSG